MVCKERQADLKDKTSGADAPMGNTRSHPEHDGLDVSGRWYYAGDGMGEQVAAGFLTGLIAQPVRAHA